MIIVHSKIRHAIKQFGHDVVREVIALTRDISDQNAENYYIEINDMRSIDCLDYLYPLPVN